MAGAIYLIKDNEQLVEMSEQAYDSEDILQALLAKYPNLLAGEQMDAGAPRRWLLVTREASIPSEEEGTGRWSIDHLFLDQDAVPTLVEVKRSSDTRIRREVVGQMLDYAANAVVYWPVETIISKFEFNCEKQGLDPEQVLNNFLGSEIAQEQFWQNAKTNLQAGRVRLVFVADLIPPELKRVVEFLNTQMDPAEVLAVEIKQFVGEGLKSLVPRVIGQTMEAQQKKSTGTREGKQWDESMFMQELEARYGPEDTTVARKLLEWAKCSVSRIWWGKGSRDGSFYAMLEYKGTSHFTFAVWTYGRVEIQFQSMKTRPPFDDEAKRIELKHRLNQIPGVSLPDDIITRRPTIFLSTLRENSSFDKFIEAFDWALQEIKKPTT